MKLFLIVAICSGITQQCMIPPGYPTLKSDYYTCIKEGILESHEVLFEKSYFKPEAIVANRLYPKFTCEKLIIPKEKPNSKLERDL